MWPVNPALNGYAYVRGEGRHKHRWKHDHAGFLPSGTVDVGKCHRSIDEATATALLRCGVVAPSPYGDDEDYPGEIYAVYRGIPYVAVPTQPGVSYHGYPWQGRMAPSIRRELERRAQQEGHAAEFKQWMKDYGT